MNIKGISKLGRGNGDFSDDKPGLYGGQSVIQKLTCGDVAFLKGELWDANKNTGLVHRSLALETGERWLLLTMDFG